jgi:hypothetical protein
VTFAILASALAALFVPAFVIVASPFLWFVRPASTRGVLAVSALAALLVAGAMSILTESVRGPSSDTLFILFVLLLPSGVGANVVLRRWNLSREMSN